MRTMPRTVLRLTLVIGLACHGTGIGWCQLLPETKPLEKDSAKLAEVEKSKVANVANPADLEAFFDGVLDLQLQSHHIAGAVVTVVLGDKVVFSKGYGYADVAKRTPVDPEKTLFRIGSISKLFTWTAVMQQIEAGKLDIDKDINTYLKDVQIPATFPEPITMKHLLTHTPGFEDNVLGLFSRKPEEVGPLGEVLRAQMPMRVRPPGILASYSNHGTAIAGHAVACVAGKSWEETLEKGILQPLGMVHTLVRQPSEDAMPEEMSKGYEWSDGKFNEKEFEYVPAAPAGCISMSGADAAKFMLAHLHDGQYGQCRILKPESARRMREPLFRVDPKTNAMCYGFWEVERNGQRLIGHGGDTLWFHSTLQLIPERGVGLFVAYNTDTGGGMANNLLKVFMNRYFPQPTPPKNEVEEGFRERANRLIGEYTTTRTSQSSVTKLSALTDTYGVKMNDDDTLTINGNRYVEIEPLVFREILGNRKIVFQEGPDGRGRYLFFADVPPMSAIRREWYDSTTVHLGVVIGSLVVFLSALLFWPVIAFNNRGLQGPHLKKSLFSGFLTWLGWLLSALAVILSVSLGIVLADSDSIVFGLTPGLKAMLVLGYICAGLAFLTVIGCVLAWRNGYWRFSGRIHYTLVALAGVAFTWFLFHWNLLLA